VGELHQAASTGLLPHKKDVHFQNRLHLVFRLLIAALRSGALPWQQQKQQRHHQQRVTAHRPKKIIFFCIFLGFKHVEQNRVPN